MYRSILLSMFSRRERVLLTWQRVLRDAVLLYALVALLRLFVADIFMVPSGSMRPTLIVGDYVFVNRLAYGASIEHSWLGRLVGLSQLWLWQHPVRGDVIVFRDPRSPDLFSVKRVVGLPGDRIAVAQSGYLSINGETTARMVLDRAADIWSECLPNGRCQRIRDNDAYRTEPAEQSPAVEIVRPDQFYVLGDDRAGSLDSRLGWQVPLANITGRVVGVAWSVDPMVSGLLNRIAKTRWMRVGETMR